MIVVLVDPSFSWTRNGTHFDVEKDSKVLMKPGSGTLVIDISGEKAEAYEGTYQCTAHNEHGTAVSNKIVIRQSSKTSEYIHLQYLHFLWLELQLQHKLFFRLCKNIICTILHL